MIDFLKYRYLNISVSALFLVASVIGFYVRGINYSVDFEGGTQILLSFSQPVNSEKIKHILGTTGWPSAIIRDFSSTEFLVRVKEFTGDAKGEAERLKSALEENLSGNEVTIRSKDSVGPAAGSNLRSKAIYAMLLGLLLMLLYVAVRFEFSFAVGAVVSLFHDAFTIIGAFILMGLEMSPNVVVAVLLILGYSINDTIVIFTRIRENMAKMTGSTMYEIVNVSINQTLTRTLLTSFATSLTVFAFLFLGGESLRDLSLALLIGIVIGTYSSIYVASPIMMLLHKNK
jgi:preprotein translocase subunit SecF